MEKQSVSNNRILDLERLSEKIEIRMRKPEDWKITLMAGAGSI